MDFPSYFDWNIQKHPDVLPVKEVPKPTLSQLSTVVFDDEGLRDGLQGTLVYPGAREMHRYIDLCIRVGITTLTVGIYSEKGSRAEEITFSCLRYLAKKYPQAIPVVVIRPLTPDILYAKECHELNENTQILIFQGSSPPRLWVQGWTEETVLEGLAKALDTVNKSCDGNTLSTLEDATRATPEFVRAFLQMSIRHKAKRIVFADTTGHLDPWGAFRFITFARQILDKEGGKSIEIDFHGHRDRNLDIPVALAALSAGATRLHGVVLGVGERAGNTALDGLLYNIVRMIEEQEGTHAFDLSKLPELCRQYSIMTNTDISKHYPLIGDHAFLTAVGIHADAQEKGMNILATLGENDGFITERKSALEKVLRTIYTSVDHKQLGRIQRYLIGPLSGEATVRMWLYHQGFDITQQGMQDIVLRIKSYAKQHQRILRDEEIYEILEKKGIKRRRPALQ